LQQGKEFQLWNFPAFSIWDKSRAESSIRYIGL
jgi:hypothetical protein